LDRRGDRRGGAGHLGYRVRRHRRTPSRLTICRSSSGDIEQATTIADVRDVGARIGIGIGIGVDGSVGPARIGGGFGITPCGSADRGRRIGTTRSVPVGAGRNWCW